MTSQQSFKKIAHVRLKSAKILLDAGDFSGSAYLMGLSLECMLKAVICKALHILYYPEKHDDKEVPGFFMTHSFHRLLLVSGLSDIFNAKGDVLAFDNWSSFVIQYPGEWVAMRYLEPLSLTRLDAKTVTDLRKYLYDDPNSIIKTIRKRKRC